MKISTKGLIIRETPTGENDKYITVLTPERGKISVYCRGVRKLKSRHLVCTQLFCYNEFILEYKNDKYWLCEASLIESFYAIREDLCAFSFAQYAVEVANEVTIEENEESDMLQLLLNTLYLACKREKPIPLVKAVFELRVAVICGVMPDLTSCVDCGTVKITNGEIYYFDILNGTIKCSPCNKKAQEENEEIYDEFGEKISRIVIMVSSATLSAMRYIISAPPKKIMNFSLDGEKIPELSLICEKYLVNQLECSFDTLDFYNQTAKV